MPFWNQWGFSFLTWNKQNTWGVVVVFAKRLLCLYGYSFKNYAGYVHIDYDWKGIVCCVFLHLHGWCYPIWQLITQGLPRITYASSQIKPGIIFKPATLQVHSHLSSLSNQLHSQSWHNLRTFPNPTRTPRPQFKNAQSISNPVLKSQRTQFGFGSQAGKRGRLED